MKLVRCFLWVLEISPLFSLRTSLWSFSLEARHNERKVVWTENRFTMSKWKAIYNLRTEGLGLPTMMKKNVEILLKKIFIMWSNKKIYQSSWHLSPPSLRGGDNTFSEKSLRYYGKVAFMECVFKNINYFQQWNTKGNTLSSESRYMSIESTEVTQGSHPVLEAFFRFLLRLLAKYTIYFYKYCNLCCKCVPIRQEICTQVYCGEIF